MDYYSKILSLSLSLSLYLSLSFLGSEIKSECLLSEVDLKLVATNKGNMNKNTNER